MEEKLANINNNNQLLTAKCHSPKQETIDNNLTYHVFKTDVILRML